MLQLLQVGNNYNVPVKQYYAESEEEVAQIQGAPVGSSVMILTEQGLVVKMLHSSGEWIEV